MGKSAQTLLLPARRRRGRSLSRAWLGARVADRHAPNVLEAATRLTPPSSPWRPEVRFTAARLPAAPSSAAEVERAVATPSPLAVQTSAPDALAPPAPAPGSPPEQVASLEDAFPNPADRALALAYAARAQRDVTASSPAKKPARPPQALRGARIVEGPAEPLAPAHRLSRKPPPDRSAAQTTKRAPTEEPTAVGPSSTEGASSHLPPQSVTATADNEPRIPQHIKAIRPSGEVPPGGEVPLDGETLPGTPAASPNLLKQAAAQPRPTGPAPATSPASSDPSPPAVRAHAPVATAPTKVSVRQPMAAETPTRPVMRLVDPLPLPANPPPTTPAPDHGLFRRALDVLRGHQELAGPTLPSRQDGPVPNPRASRRVPAIAQHRSALPSQTPQTGVVPPAANPPPGVPVRNTSSSEPDAVAQSGSKTSSLVDPLPSGSETSSRKGWPPASRPASGSPSTSPSPGRPSTAPVPPRASAPASPRSSGEPTALAPSPAPSSVRGSAPADRAPMLRLTAGSSPASVAAIKPIPVVVRATSDTSSGINRAPAPVSTGSARSPAAQLSPQPDQSFVEVSESPPVAAPAGTASAPRARTSVPGASELAPGGRAGVPAAVRHATAKPVPVRPLPPQRATQQRQREAPQPQALLRAPTRGRRMLDAARHRRPADTTGTTAPLPTMSAPRAVATPGPVPTPRLHGEAALIDAARLSRTPALAPLVGPTPPFAARPVAAAAPAPATPAPAPAAPGAAPLPPARAVVARQPLAPSPRSLSPAPLTVARQTATTAPAGGAGIGGGDADAVYDEVLRRVREEQEQLGQIIQHPF
jgi:hypothetical protein